MASRDLYRTGTRATHPLTPGFSGRHKTLAASGTDHWRLNPGDVFPWMRRTIGQFEVRDPVIGLVAVDVMDEFVSREWSIEMSRHDESVFDGVAAIVAHQMVVTDIDKDISIRDGAAAAPSVSIGSEPARKMFPSTASFAHGLSLVDGGHYSN